MSKLVLTRPEVDIMSARIAKPSSIKVFMRVLSKFTVVIFNMKFDYWQLGWIWDMCHIKLICLCECWNNIFNFVHGSQSLWCKTASFFYSLAVLSIQVPLRLSWCIGNVLCSVKPLLSMPIFAPAIFGQPVIWKIIKRWDEQLSKLRCNYLC